MRFLPTSRLSAAAMSYTRSEMISPTRRSRRTRSLTGNRLPRCVGPLGRGHRPAHVGGAGLSEPAEQLAVVNRREFLATYRGGLIAAVDIQGMALRGSAADSLQGRLERLVERSRRVDTSSHR